MSRDFIVQAQVIKREPPYVQAGIVTTIVGKDGSLIYTGSGVPSNELGVFTDLYIDNVAPNNFYQKNMLNVWVLKGQLKGIQGDDGREVLIQNNGTYIQWQYEGDETWTNIVEVSTLKGDTGSNIELQKGTTHIQWRVVGDVDWINLIALSELKGDAGRGIISFDLINTVGKTKTYRLLYTDSTYVDINIVDGNDGNDGTGAYQIYVVGGGTLSEAEFNAAITLIPTHIADETIHHTIEELNLLYSDINHNHNLNDLTEKSYNSLTDKPNLSSLHTHANKEDLDNYDPDNFEPANSNIQEHIADTDIHIDSSSELGEAINESTHSLLLWNGLKALKVTFARLKTWIASYFFAIGGNNFGAKKLIGSTDNQDFGIITNNTERVTIEKNGNFKVGQLVEIRTNGATIIDGEGGATPALTLKANRSGWFQSINIYGGPSIGVGNQMQFGQYDDGKMFFFNTGDNPIGFFIKNVELLSIAKTTGFVGIFTTDPKSRLQVVGGIQFGDDTAAASADKVGTIRQRDVDNKTKLEFVRNNNGTYEWEQINDKLSLDQTAPQTLTDSPIIDTLVSGQMCHVDSNKKLVAIPVYWDAVNNRMGVGVSNLSKKFETNGDVKIGYGGGLYFGQNTTNAIIGSLTNVTDYFNFFAYWGTIISDYTGEIMRASNGKVGIGTIVPKSKLQVNGGIQFGDDTSAASADKEFTIRGRKGVRDGNIGFSVTEMCMPTDVNTWNWVEIVRNEWIIP